MWELFALDRFKLKQIKKVSWRKIKYSRIITKLYELLPQIFSRGRPTYVISMLTQNDIAIVTWYWSAHQHGMVHRKAPQVIFHHRQHCYILSVLSIALRLPSPSFRLIQFHRLIVLVLSTDDNIQQLNRVIVFLDPNTIQIVQVSVYTLIQIVAITTAGSNTEPRLGEVNKWQTIRSTVKN